NQVNTQEATQVHIPSEPSRPRFKLGMRSPTVSPADSTHQISEEQATRVASNLNNPVVRPVAPAAPTPPVGAYLQQQQPMQPQYQQQAPVQAPIQQQQTPQAMKLPDTARVVQGQIYLPAEGNG